MSSAEWLDLLRDFTSGKLDRREFATRAFTTGASAGEIATTITNHVNASTAQFITGGMDPNDDGAWNDYVGTLDAMGLTQYLEVQQAAYEAKYGG